LIAADVGGTYARIGLIDAGADPYSFSISRYRQYACADFPGLAAILADFSRSVAQAPIERLALAIAGHVVDDAVVNINLPWPVSIRGLRTATGARDLAVVNDFAAAAHAIGHIDAADTTLLSGPTHAPPGAVLVVGPGTGLGVAVRIAQGEHPVILATEAGQASLAATTEYEFDLLRELRKRSPRVRIEDVLSGTGLAKLHAAVCALRRVEPRATTPAQISAAALDGSDPLAYETVDTFCGWFGGMLGDFALSYGAWGGVYLTGGVLPRIRELLMRSAVVERFLDKGALRAALARTPVRLVDHARLGVIGAASWYFARTADASGMD
jgi:glucokinase